MATQLFHKHEPIVLDIGTGTGHLSSQVKQIFQSMNADGVNYNGVEFDPNFAARSQRALNGATVIAGNGFAPAKQLREALQLDEKKPDIVLASHSFMYSPNIAESVENVRDQLNPNSMAIFVNLSPQADTVAVTRGFTEDMGASVDAKLKDNFERLKMKHHAVKFRAHMFFPEINDALWSELKEAKPYDDTHNPHAAHKDGLVARKMVEFVLQRPLEALSQQERDRYLEGLKKKLRVQGNALYLDNIIEIAVSPEADRQTLRAVQMAAEATNSQAIGIK